MLCLSLETERESAKMGTTRSRDNCLKQDAGTLCKSQHLSILELNIALLSMISRELRIASPKTPESLTGTTCANKLSGD
jgi:hypothetical protein